MRPFEWIRLLALVGVAGCIVGCNGPMAWMPGGALVGPEQTAQNWTAAAAGADTLELETRPEDPYSVRIGFVLRDGDLYIDPAEERSWYAYLVENNAVRVRFADSIYRAEAVEVTDVSELAGFDATRHVFRLEPAD
jgi:hypothetical protein